MVLRSSLASFARPLTACEIVPAVELKMLGLPAPREAIDGEGEVFLLPAEGVIPTGVLMKKQTSSPETLNLIKI